VSESLRLSFRRSNWLSSGTWRIAVEFDAEMAGEIAAHAAAICEADPDSSWRIETTGGRPVPVSPDVIGDVGLRAEIDRLRAKLAKIAAAVLE